MPLPAIFRCPDRARPPPLNRSAASEATPSPPTSTPNRPARTPRPRPRWTADRADHCPDHRSRDHRSRDRRSRAHLRCRGDCRRRGPRTGGNPTLSRSLSRSPLSRSWSTVAAAPIGGFGSDSQSSHIHAESASENSSSSSRSPLDNGLWSPLSRSPLSRSPLVQIATVPIAAVERIGTAVVTVDVAAHEPAEVAVAVPLAVQAVPTRAGAPPLALTGRRLRVRLAVLPHPRGVGQRALLVVRDGRRAVTIAVQVAAVEHSAVGMIVDVAAHEPAEIAVAVPLAVGCAVACAAAGPRPPPGRFRPDARPPRGPARNRGSGSVAVAASAEWPRPVAATRRDVRRGPSRPCESAATRWPRRPSERREQCRPCGAADGPTRGAASRAASPLPRALRCHATPCGASPVHCCGCDLWPSPPLAARRPCSARPSGSGRCGEPHAMRIDRSPGFPP